MSGWKEEVEEVGGGELPSGGRSERVGRGIGIDLAPEPAHATVVASAPGSERDYSSKSRSSA